MTNQFASPNDPDAPIVRIDDVGNNDATTTSLIVGLPARAAIDYVGDVDWFKVDFDALTTYQITLKGSASGGGTLPSGTSVTLSTVQVWDPATRSYLYGGYGNAGEPNLSVPIEKAGTYFVAVSANYVTGSYTLQAAALLHDDYTGNGYNALDKSLGSFHANFDYAGDNDAFKYHLEAGKTYKFTLKTDDGLSLNTSLSLNVPPGVPSLRNSSVPLVGSVA